MKTRSGATANAKGSPGGQWRKLAVLAAGAGGILLMAVSESAALPCLVPSGFATIQLALDNAGCDPILVAPGAPMTRTGRPSR